MNNTDRPIANPVVLLREESDDWAVLFNPDTNEAAGVNPVGIEVWKRMDGRSSIEDIVSAIESSFEDTPDIALNEINAFVNTLAENGFARLELEIK